MAEEEALIGQDAETVRAAQLVGKSSDDRVVGFDEDTFGWTALLAFGDHVDRLPCRPAQGCAEAAGGAEVAQEGTVDGRQARQLGLDFMLDDAVEDGGHGRGVWSTVGRGKSEPPHAHGRTGSSGWWPSTTRV